MPIHSAKISMGIYSTDGGSSLILAGLGFLESGRILCGILKFSSKKKRSIHMEAYEYNAYQERTCEADILIQCLSCEMMESKPTTLTNILVKRVHHSQIHIKGCLLAVRHHSSVASGIAIFL